METIKSIVSILVAALALTFIVQNVSGQSNATTTTTTCNPQCDTFCCAVCTRCLLNTGDSFDCGKCANSCNK